MGDFMNKDDFWPESQNEPIRFYPIGRVVNRYNEASDGYRAPLDVSQIILDPSLEPGLDGLIPGQQLVVLFYFHHIQDFELYQHPKGDPNRLKRGVFTIRSPRRPNPIGMTVVELVAIHQNKLEVRGLDAFNGTPVIDIKPAQNTGG